jgi:hypothetical protein
MKIVLFSLCICIERHAYLRIGMIRHRPIRYKITCTYVIYQDFVIYKLKEV